VSLALVGLGACGTSVSDTDGGTGTIDASTAPIDGPLADAPAPDATPSRCQVGPEVALDSLGLISTSLVWNGTEFAAAWDTWESSSWSYDIFFARLDPDGQIQGSKTQVNDSSQDAVVPILVWTGSGYGVFWGDYGSVPYLSRLDSAGGKVGTDVRLDGIVAGHVSVVWLGSEYGIAWEQQDSETSDVLFARLDADGNRIGTEVVIAADTAHHPALVWTGSEFGVVWTDSRDGDYEIYFARLDASGAKIGSDEQVSDGPRPAFNPTVAWTGSDYGVAWVDARDCFRIYFGRLDAEGAKLGGDSIVTPGDIPGGISTVTSLPVLVWTGTDYGLAWLISGLSTAFALLHADGSKPEANLLVPGSRQFWRPALAVGGAGFGMTYQSGSPRLPYFRTVTCPE